MPNLGRNKANGTGRGGWVQAQKKPRYLLWEGTHTSHSKDIHVCGKLKWRLIRVCSGMLWWIAWALRQLSAGTDFGPFGVDTSEMQTQSFDFSVPVDRSQLLGIRNPYKHL